MTRLLLLRRVQLAAVMAGTALHSWGKNPNEAEEPEELEGYGDDEEADDVFAAAEPAADGAW